MIAEIELVEGWSLLDPWFLVLVPVAIAIMIWRIRWPRAALPTASVGLLTGLPRTLRSRVVWLPTTCIVLGATALSVGLSRPVTREVMPIRAEGLDILLLIDTSRSMLHEDMVRGSNQRRIEAAREQALEFAKARKQDRVGLMTFALFPDLRCPLTLDKQAIAAFLRVVETVPEGSDENQTAIGRALAQAASFLEKSETKTKVIVLLTDGQSTVHDVTPMDAAKLAKDAGIRVHTIGLGKAQRVGRLFPQLVEPDFKDLEKISEMTGGKFFRARSTADLEGVYTAIDAEEKVELEDPRYRTSDWFEVPLSLGALLVLLGLLLELFWIREVP